MRFNRFKKRFNLIWTANNNNGHTGGSDDSGKDKTKYAELMAKRRKYFKYWAAKNGINDGSQMNPARFKIFDKSFRHHFGLDKPQHDNQRSNQHTSQYGNSNEARFKAAENSFNQSHQTSHSGPSRYNQNTRNNQFNHSNSSSNHNHNTNDRVHNNNFKSPHKGGRSKKDFQKRVQKRADKMRNSSNKKRLAQIRRENKQYRKGIKAYRDIKASRNPFSAQNRAARAKNPGSYNKHRRAMRESTIMPTGPRGIARSMYRIAHHSRSRAEHSRMLNHSKLYRFMEDVFYTMTDLNASAMDSRVFHILSPRTVGRAVHLHHVRAKQIKPFKRQLKHNKKIAAKLSKDGKDKSKGKSKDNENTKDQKSPKKPIGKALKNALKGDGLGL